MPKAETWATSSTIESTPGCGGAPEQVPQHESAVPARPAVYAIGKRRTEAAGSTNVAFKRTYGPVVAKRDTDEVAGPSLINGAVACSIIIHALLKPHGPVISSSGEPLDTPDKSEPCRFLSRL